MNNKNLELFWEFLKIGLFTIGGGMAMIPQIEQVVVKDKEWLTSEEMIDCVAISQSMPGVIAINSATYIGKKVNGIRGSLAATIGVILPSLVIIMLVVTILGSIGDNPYVTGAFVGIKAAVSALILLVVVRMGKQILTGAFQWIVAVYAGASIIVFGVNAVWVVLAGALVGIIYSYVKVGEGS
jgi:chromate transporter